MTPRKKVDKNLVKVRITGPRCRLDDRLYQPGETATVPAEIAQEWILDERAVPTAEVPQWHQEEQ
jgi:hypothetical protein